MDNKESFEITPPACVITRALGRAAVGLPVEGAFLPDPAGVPLPSHEQQVEQSYEAEHQADEEQLPEGRYQQPGKNLGRQAEMPRGREKARKADPVNRQRGKKKKDRLSKAWLKMSEI